MKHADEVAIVKLAGGEPNYHRLRGLCAATKRFGPAVPAIETHQALLGRPPHYVAADAAFYSAKNEAAAKAIGVTRVCFPIANQKRRAPAASAPGLLWLMRTVGDGSGIVPCYMCAAEIAVLRSSPTGAVEPATCCGADTRLHPFAESVEKPTDNMRQCRRLLVSKLGLI